MIFLMQLEPLEQRYTEQWARWIVAGAHFLGLDYTVVEGKALTTRIETGSVLDAHSTSHWKATQMAAMIKKIKDGDVKDGDTVWFADLWNPDVLHLAYIRDLSGIKFKITGVLHAGSWDKTDFINRTGIGAWCGGFEKSLFTVADEIYLGSGYHKKMIINSIPYGAPRFDDKLRVTGLFFNPYEIRKGRTKKPKDPNLVLFCHRLDPEKHPEKFDALKKRLKKTKLKFVKTVDRNLTKAQYYDLLEEATYAVSFEGQETFGYTVLECMALGVIPLVFNGMSYEETVSPLLRWDTESQLDTMLTKRFYSDKPEKQREVEQSLLEATMPYLPYKVLAKMFPNEI